MPLDTGGLNGSLTDLFADPPHEAGACAQAWSDAMRGYASGVVPASTTVGAAADALAGAMESAFAAGAAAVESAFSDFATTVAGGMTPAGFTGAPPPAPVGFAALLATTQDTREGAASAWASKIDAWMRTGTGTLIAPPNTVTPWS